MFLRTVLISFVIGVILAFTFGYYVNNFSPFELSKIEELIKKQEVEEGDFNTLNEKISEIIDEGLILDYISINGYVGYGIAMMSIVFLFASVHIFFDKLFFKKYYERASFFDAFRRGLLIVAFITITLYSKLILLNSTEVLAAAYITLIALEILVAKFIKPDIKKWIKRVQKRIGKINDKSK